MQLGQPPLGGATQSCMAQWPPRGSPAWPGGTWSLPLPFFGLSLGSHHTQNLSLTVGTGEGCAPPNPRAEDGANHKNPAPWFFP